MLVAAARSDAALVSKTSTRHGCNLLHPIVMDASFSYVDEIHINNISGIFPEIVEQVILIVMKKDWTYVEKTIGDRVGASYLLKK